MKKALIGCLVVGLVLLVLGAASAYWFIVRPLVSAGGAVLDGARQWAQVSEVEKDVVNQQSFMPPADGLLSQAQVDAYIRVQSTLQAGYSAEIKALAEDYESADGEVNPEHADMGLDEALATFGDLGAMTLKVKKARVAALNEVGLSMDEYRWIRGQAYAALPWIVAASDPNLKSAPEAETPQVEAEAPSVEAPTPAVEVETPAIEADAAVVVSPSGPSAGTLPVEVDPFADSAEEAAAKYNAELLKPHRELLEQSLSSVWLDL